MRQSFRLDYLKEWSDCTIRKEEFKVRLPDLEIREVQKYKQFIIFNMNNIYKQLALADRGYISTLIDVLSNNLSVDVNIVLKNKLPILNSIEFLFKIINTERYSLNKFIFGDMIQNLVKYKNLTLNTDINDTD